MQRIIIYSILILLFLNACERRGDKFQHFDLKETTLGKVQKHEISKLFFINKDTGLFAITKDSILRTTDGCKTFSIAIADAGHDFHSIWMAPSGTGYITRKSNLIYKTTDFGATWSEIPVDNPNMLIDKMVCLNKDTLFLISSSASGEKGSYILRSRDGGNTWQTTKISECLNLCFLDDSVGFSICLDGLLKTNDGGFTWKKYSDQIATELLFVDKDTIFSTTGRSLFRSYDGGVTWQNIKNIVNTNYLVGDDMSKIEHLNLLQGNDLVFTLNSRIIKITGKGTKWFQHESSRPYVQLQMLNRSTGIVYGYESIVEVNF